jgi:hypothetical protein
MLSLIIALIFFIIFIFLIIFAGNYLLRHTIDHYINNHQENFENNFLSDDKNIELNDDCTKLDLKSQKILNFQTATNIPLSQNNYSNYVGKIHMIKDKNHDQSKNKISLKHPLLLYDGIWKSTIAQNEDGYEHQYWNLTNGNIGIDGYWSDDLIRTNKNIPDNYIDKTAICNNPPENNYFNYCNDTVYDVEDKEIECFPEIFTAGMVSANP